MCQVYHAVLKQARGRYFRSECQILHECVCIDQGGGQRWGGMTLALIACADEFTFIKCTLGYLFHCKIFIFLQLRGLRRVSPE